MQELSSQKAKTLNTTTAQVMIRLRGFRLQIRAKGVTRHFSQAASLPKKHKGRISRVLQIGGKTETIVSACKKTAARTNHGKIGTKSHVDLGNQQNDAAAKASPI